MHAYVHQQITCSKQYFLQQILYTLSITIFVQPIPMNFIYAYRAVKLCTYRFPKIALYSYERYMNESTPLQQH